MSRSGTWQTAAAEQIRPFHRDRTDQKTAIGSAHDAKPRGRGQAAGDHVLGDGYEVVIGLLPVCPECRLMPGRTKFAAPADVRNRKSAAFRQQSRPMLAQ